MIKNLSFSLGKYVNDNIIPDKICIIYTIPNIDPIFQKYLNVIGILNFKPILLIVLNGGFEYKNDIFKLINKYF